MDADKLMQDAVAGKISADKLVELIVVLHKQNQALQERVQELEKELASRSPTARLDEPYSQKAEEKRQATDKRRKRQKSPRRGRISTAEKIKLAERTEQVFPDGVPPEECTLSHTRVAWRLENGRAVLVAYEIYRFRNHYGQPAGLWKRSEYGMEIVLAIAYQVYCVGLSLDKACAVLSFFQQLKLSKSQADALLNQLARSWESEFNTLCTLLANAAVVYCDETSWSIKSVWAFLNDKLTVLFYGVHKDGASLQQILNKEVFAGILVSDDAAVYQGFSQSQKCWAHLLRKAIKLTLQAKENSTYRDFADRLLAIYRKAKRYAADGRLGDAGRAQRVEELDNNIIYLCTPRWYDTSTSGGKLENDYRRLCCELMALMFEDELFVFVRSPEVDGTNNASERQLRPDATARATGRTSKTPWGAKRRSIISSVLQSIGKHVTSFTLENVIQEVKRWMTRGRSCFTDRAKAAKLKVPESEPSILNRLILGAAT